MSENHPIDSSTHLYAQVQVLNAVVVAMLVSLRATDRDEFDAIIGTIGAAIDRLVDIHVPDIDSAFLYRAREELKTVAQRFIDGIK